MSNNIKLKETDEYVIIPGSMRPDGSFRPDRKVKKGFIPPDEVASYDAQTRGAANPKKERYIPGLNDPPPQSEIKLNTPAPIIYENVMKNLVQDSRRQTQASRQQLKEKEKLASGQSYASALTKNMKKPSPKTLNAHRDLFKSESSFHYDSSSFSSSSSSSSFSSSPSSSSSSSSSFSSSSSSCSPSSPSSSSNNTPSASPSTSVNTPNIAGLCRRRKLLRKKHREALVLKDKADKEGNDGLNADQLAKMERIPEMEKEISAISEQIRELKGEEGEGEDDDGDEGAEEKHKDKERVNEEDKRRNGKDENDNNTGGGGKWKKNKKKKGGDENEGW